MHSEKANSSAGSGASIIKALGVSEDAHAEGEYSVRCIGPAEAYRGRYIELRDRLSASGLAGFLDRLVNGAKLLKEFVEIPMEMKWADTFCNVVCTQGKNVALDAFLGGSGYSVVGPYLGLINANASAAVVGDTMASHSGWLEVGVVNAPTYTGPRKTVSWSAATGGSKAMASAQSFAITGSGTVGGCFLVFGTGAVSTIDSTGGYLYSAGAFSGGSKTVSNGDTLSVSYSASL